MNYDKSSEDPDHVDMALTRSISRGYQSFYLAAMDYAMLYSSSHYSLRDTPCMEALRAIYTHDKAGLGITGIVGVVCTLC